MRKEELKKGMVFLIIGYEWVITRFERNGVLLVKMIPEHPNIFITYESFIRMTPIWIMEEDELKEYNPFDHFSQLKPGIYKVDCMILPEYQESLAHEIYQEKVFRKKHCWKFVNLPVRRSVRLFNTGFPTNTVNSVKRELWKMKRYWKTNWPASSIFGRTLTGLKPIYTNLLIKHRHAYRIKRFSVLSGTHG